ncbi:30S ribosomal protein S4 [Henriciella sp. AS95]|uniref:30S ribosomal protein S4 n=1 Tax=Henriciella sp. AS95 TaxID=3135782 RepID=UPI003170AE1C
MSRRHSTKYKIDRRVGENIWGRPKSPVNKRPTKPGQHGQGRRQKVSDYGMQLMAKQKLKFHYGDITEKQFRKTFDEANRMKGNTAENLIGLLESRLDAFVYRSKFVPTIFAARQFVNHGHVKLNGVKTNIGSVRLKAGDVVEIREKSRNLALVLEALGSPERDVPEYIDVDPKAMTATFVRVPELNDVPYAVKMEPAQVVEFYSS